MTETTPSTKATAAKTPDEMADRICDDCYTLQRASSKHNDPELDTIAQRLWHIARSVRSLTVPVPAPAPAVRATPSMPAPPTAGLREVFSEFFRVHPMTDREKEFYVRAGGPTTDQSDLLADEWLSCPTYRHRPEAVLAWVEKARCYLPAFAMNMEAEAGLRPETATELTAIADLFYAKPLCDEERRVLTRIYGASEQPYHRAFNWMDAGLTTASEVAAWMDAGVFHVDCATSLKEAGFTPEDAARTVTESAVPGISYGRFYTMRCQDEETCFRSMLAAREKAQEVVGAYLPEPVRSGTNGEVEAGPRA